MDFLIKVRLDYEHLIEELEALGREQKNAVESLVIQVMIVILSTLATPGTDIVSPLILAVTLLILYEFSIILVKAGGK